MLEENRIKHIVGVANYMYNNAEKYDLNKEDMYILGFLHDIGYLKQQKNHEIFGAELLKENNYRYSNIIRFHGISPNNYYDKENIPKELILLWEADLSVNSIGENVGFIKRLEDVKNRYGENSINYVNCQKTINWLKEKKYI